MARFSKAKPLLCYWTKVFAGWLTHKKNINLMKYHHHQTENTITQIQISFISELNFLGFGVLRWLPGESTSQLPAGVFLGESVRPYSWSVDNNKRSLSARAFTILNRNCTVRIFQLWRMHNPLSKKVYRLSSFKLV